MSDVSEVATDRTLTVYGDTGNGKVRIFRDIVNDNTTDGVDDTVGDPVVVTRAGIGLKIDFDFESLWTNEGGDSAAVVMFPAGFGARETAFQFTQRSIPCDVTGKTVGDVFGYLGTISPDGVSGDYVVYLYDEGNRTAGRPYTLATAADSFSEDYSVFMAVATDRYVSIADCTDFTDPDLVFAGGTIFGLPDYMRTATLVSLPGATTPPGGVSPDDDFARVLANNPYPREILVSDIVYIDTVGIDKSLAAAEAAEEISATFYIYDTGVTNASGQNYRAVTGAGTPPFGDRIQGHEGFWVTVLKNGADGAAEGDHSLVIGQSDLE